MSGGASYASKHDLEAREAQWYGGKPGGSTMSSSYGSPGFAGSSPGPKKYGGGGGDGGLTLPPLGKSGKLSESAAMEMEAVRLLVKRGARMRMRMRRRRRMRIKMRIRTRTRIRKCE